jgi:hypothetical protein
MFRHASNNALHVFLSRIAVICFTYAFVEHELWIYVCIDKLYNTHIQEVVR